MRQIVVLLILGVFATDTLLVGGVPVKGRVVCYWGTWNTGGEFPSSRIPGDKCTHAIYSFIGLDTNTWRVTAGDQNAINQFLALRNTYPNVKLVAAVGGGSAGSGPYSDMASLFGRRSIFIQSLVDFLHGNNFDGIDMDWEYPGVDWSGGRPGDKVNFVSFLRELRAAFNGQGRGWEITLAVSVVPKNIQDGYDIPNICPLVDAVHLMTYDMHGPWEAVADVHSPLFPRLRDGNSQLNTKDGAFNWNQSGCERYKLIVGVPFYGYHHKLQNPGQNQIGAPIVTGESTTEKYSQFCRNVNGGGWIREWDNEGLVPFMHSATDWIGYEDLESLQLKLDWIQNEGYGGTMVWAIDQDDFTGICGPQSPLTNAIHNAMKDYYAEKP